MQIKKERRGKRLGSRQAILLGTAIGLAIILLLCLVTAMLVSSEKLPEDEISTFAIFAMAVGEAAAAFAAARISDVKTGALTAAVLIMIRVAVGAFSHGQLFGKTTVITLAAMAICGVAGAALGGRRIKRRKI